MPVPRVPRQRGEAGCSWVLPAHCNASCPPLPAGGALRGSSSGVRGIGVMLSSWDAGQNGSGKGLRCFSPSLGPCDGAQIWESSDPFGDSMSPPCESSPCSGSPQSPSLHLPKPTPGFPLSPCAAHVSFLSDVYISGPFPPETPFADGLRMPRSLLVYF